MTSPVNGTQAVSPNTIVRTSPHDGTPLAGIPMATRSEVVRAVERARDVQEEWASRPLAMRVKALKRAAKAMLADRASFVSLTKEEMGKHAAEGIFTEALGHLDAVGSWAKVIEPALSRKVSLNPLNFPKKRARIDLVPRGIIGIIAPWNFPVAGLYRSVIPSLLMGNAIIVKPSEVTPKTSALFVEHLARELPYGLASVVHGDGSVGAMLVESGIDACTFTGSVAAGAKVRVRCAELGIPCSVEMGGKDAALVLADCDLARTVAGITHWALSNTGQACGAIEVAYVEDKIADTFVTRMQNAWEHLRTARDRTDDATDISPLASARQLAIVEAHVKDAIAKGAKLVCGGKRHGSGYAYLPTLLDRCDSSMDVVREETFGPVLAVVRVPGAGEAIRQINAAKYGLGASVWTADTARGERLAMRMNVGVASVNNHAFTGAVPALPWTGTRSTGFGIANSEWSLLNFARPRAVIVDENAGAEIFWLPYGEDLRELGDLLAGAQIGQILSAWKIPLLLRKRGKRVRDHFGMD